MQDIIVTKRGEYECVGECFSDGNQTHLLHSEKNFEAIVEIMPKGTVGCFYTMDGCVFEFYYILRGLIEICEPEERVILGPGDTYAYHKLTRNVMFRILEDAEILGVNTNPYYDAYQSSVNQLNAVMGQLQAVDGETLDHCTRVKELSMGIAYFVGFDQTQLLNLFYAAKFHDVGKSKIPVEILLKPDRLTAEEYEIMKEHSRYTYEMILEHYGETIADMAFEHHERLDGKGYPRSLKGDEISLAARILCVADAYDAMTVTRPYRKAMPKENAMAELRRGAETQFDGSVIDALEAYLSSLE